MANDALGPLVAALEHARGDADQIKLLIALGNSGHPAVLSLARARLGHPSDRVRAAALQALRRVDDSAADRLLAEALGDPSPDVRRSALDALRERSPTAPAVHAVSVALLQESAPGVRAEALNLALRWARQGPGLLEALRHVSQHDPITSLRQAASGGLDTASASRP